MSFEDTTEILQESRDRVKENVERKMEEVQENARQDIQEINRNLDRVHQDLVASHFSEATNKDIDYRSDYIEMKQNHLFSHLSEIEHDVLRQHLNEFSKHIHDIEQDCKRIFNDPHEFQAMIDRVKADNHEYTDGKDGRPGPTIKELMIEGCDNPQQVLLHSLRNEGFYQGIIGDKSGYKYQFFRDIETQSGPMREHIRMNEPTLVDEKNHIYRVEIVGELHRDIHGNLIYGEGIYGDLEPTGVEHILSTLHYLHREYCNRLQEMNFIFDQI